jgi:hypothetical protein
MEHPIWDGYPEAPNWRQRVRLVFQPTYTGVDLPITTAAYADAIIAAAGGAFVDGSTDGAKQTVLVDRIKQAVKQPRGAFAALMAIESKLVQMDENALVARRYWTIRDRFRRVASPEAINAYNRWSPNELDEPVPAEFAVNQAVRQAGAEETAARDTLTQAVAELFAADAALAKADDAAKANAQTDVDAARTRLEEATKAYGEKVAVRVAAEAVAAAAAVSANTPPPTPVNSVAPAIDGTPQDGQTLSVSNGTWSGAPTFAYAWLRDGTPIVDATAADYVLTGADVGCMMSCTVNATDAGGSAAATAAGVGPVQATSQPE